MDYFHDQWKCYWENKEKISNDEFDCNYSILFIKFFHDYFYYNTEMGETPSKPVQFVAPSVLKENIPPQKRIIAQIKTPELKANFNYINPIHIGIEDMPDD